MTLTSPFPRTRGRDAFLTDSAPDAYERCVDRLLRSPALRRVDGLCHWMDAAHCAEGTHGHDHQGPDPEPNRLASYQATTRISTFTSMSQNSRFVRGTSCGDVLADPRGLCKTVAWGFLSQPGPGDESSTAGHPGKTPWIARSEDIWIATPYGHRGHERP